MYKGKIDDFDECNIIEYIQQIILEYNPKITIKKITLHGSQLNNDNDSIESNGIDIYIEITSKNDNDKDKELIDLKNHIRRTRTEYNGTNIDISIDNIEFLEFINKINTSKLSQYYNPNHKTLFENQIINTNQHSKTKLKSKSTLKINKNI